MPRVHRHDKQPKTQEIMQQQLHKNNIPCHPDSYRDDRSRDILSTIQQQYFYNAKLVMLNLIYFVQFASSGQYLTKNYAK